MTLNELIERLNAVKAALPDANPKVYILDMEFGRDLSVNMVDLDENDDVILIPA